MTISNNHQILADIKNSQVKNDNQNTLDGINASNKKTPLAHYCESNDWNTDLPENDQHDVFLLLSLTSTNTKKREIITNAHIVFIEGVIHIQNSNHVFLDEDMLIGWMSKAAAIRLLERD